MHKTYNQIIEILNAFADASPFINNFGTGFKAQLNDIVKNRPEFTTMFMEPLDISLNNNTIDYRLRIFSLDKRDKNDDNSRDILSDTAQVLTDLRKYLIYNFEESDIWSVQFDSVLLVPVNNYTNDYTVGWYMDIKLSGAQIAGDCDVPGIPVLCDPVDFYINDELVASSASPVFYNVIDTDGNPVGELITSGDWEVPTSCLPIDILSDLGCEIDNIATCPSNSDFVLGQGILEVASAQTPLSYTNKVKLVGTEVEAIDYIDDGCTAQITLKTVFPIVLDNGLGGTTDTITTGAFDGSTFIVNDIRIFDGEFGTDVYVNMEVPAILRIEATITSYTQSADGLTTVIQVSEGTQCDCFEINIQNSDGCLIDVIQDCDDTCTSHTWQLVITGGTTVEGITLLDCNGVTYDTIAGPITDGTYTYCHASVDQPTIETQIGLGIEWTDLGEQCSFFELPDIEVSDKSGVLGTYASPASILFSGSGSVGISNCVMTITPDAASGIVYAQLIPNESIQYRQGDPYWHLSEGTFSPVEHVTPLNYATIDTDAQQSDVRTTPATGTLSTDSVLPTMLKANNAFGNKFRFTDDTGQPSNATVGSNIWAHVDWANHDFVTGGATRSYVIDHYYGVGMITSFITDAVTGKYSLDSTNGQSWETWIDYVDADYTTGNYSAGDSGWMVGSVDMMTALPHGMFSFNIGGGWTKDFFTGQNSGSASSRFYAMTGTTTRSSTARFQAMWDSDSTTMAGALTKATSTGFSHRICCVLPIRMDRR